MQLNNAITRAFSPRGFIRKKYDDTEADIMLCQVLQEVKLDPKHDDELPIWAYELLTQAILSYKDRIRIILAHNREILGIDCPAEFNIQAGKRPTRMTKIKRFLKDKVPRRYDKDGNRNPKYDKYYNDDCRRQETKGDDSVITGLSSDPNKKCVDSQGKSEIGRLNPQSSRYAIKKVITQKPTNTIHKEQDKEQK